MAKKVAPKELQAVLSRVKLDGEMICDMVKNFKKYFGRGSAAGTSQSLIANAERRHRKFIPGQRATAEGFALLG